MKPTIFTRRRHSIQPFSLPSSTTTTRTKLSFSLQNTNQEQSRANTAVAASKSDSQSSSSSSTSIADYLVAVVAPLRYVGPYACLGLRFPHLHLEDDDDKNVTLGFLLDTGANVNSIQSHIAQQLDLPIVWSVANQSTTTGASLIGTGGTSTNGAGNIVLLGDCELAGLPPGQTTTFMTNVTAASLPWASPVGHGLLGLAFLQSFVAGVEFDWYGTDGDPPTFIFYYGKDIHESVKSKVLQNMVCVPLQQELKHGGLLSLTININGVDLPAILDTGSPVTILNPRAAQLAGIDIAVSNMSALSRDNDNDEEEDDSDATARQTMQQQQRRQQVGDDALQVAGVDGAAMNLHRSSTKVPVRVATATPGEYFSFGRNDDDDDDDSGHYVYVGDMPGLNAMAQIGSVMFGVQQDEEEDGGNVESSPPPIVVLGLDCLKQTYRMILRVGGLGTQSEAWFEPLEKSNSA